MTNHTLQKSMFQSGCILAGTAVILGAFGAHALKDVLEPTELATFETGVRYQFLHAFGTLMISLSLRRLKEKTARNVWYLFIAGSILFCASLYLLAMRSMLGLPEQLKAIGAITPVGGLSFIAGWLLLAFNGFKVPDAEEQHRSRRRSRRTQEHTEHTPETE
ncbi:MAG: DUF423 domain-containing protein [Bacteroidota bacterium]